MKRTAFILLLICLNAPAFSHDRQLMTTFLFSIDLKGSAQGALRLPESVCFDASGNLYIADTGNHRILKTDSNGQPEVLIGSFGWEKEQFQIPVDIFVYNSLDVYVADYDNQRIERYDKDLNWITSLYSNSNWEENHQFEFPRAVCKSLHGDYFIIDAQNDRITKFNASFEPELTFGDFDWGQGILEQPEDIFVSLQDIVYVTDKDAGKIRVYDYYGNFLSDIGEGALSAPSGISGDDKGIICVSDVDLDKIFFFDRSGVLLYSMGASGDKFGAFSSPASVAFKKGRLAVADTGNNRIQVFKVNWTN